MSEALTLERLRSLTPLNVLSEQQWRELRRQLVPQPVLAGQSLFRRGDRARLTYYLLSGELLLEDAAGTRQRLVAGAEASCHPLSPGLPRLQDALALTDASVLVLDSDALNRLVTWRLAHQDLLLELGQLQDEPEWLERLLDSPLFAKVPPANVRTMLARLQSVELPAGTEVLREGEAGDCCYFLKRGRVEVIRGAGTERQVLAELELGACFGEEALLADCPRNATVTVVEDAQVLRLARQDFVALLKAPVVNEIGLGEAARLLAAGAQWLDVRLQGEYERAHAAQALHMPLQLLRLKARLLDKARTYLCYCDSGKRSASAVFLLSQLGFSCYALREGLDALPAVQRDGLVCESGAGYLARSGGRIERSH
ncbi:cyclic nucleotide-binding domain-containing protein [Pseudomonas lalucatii]|uniref:Cyclic nucleotide-binding domain-containing protein n=1 Tax=Pseudomonas lalucatii TaxID=1424203 RepID=A0ABS5Q337_9PSED|nr:cyclic nucleotide-binding domain-containing protein [Pseudomonas lalucatii]MBS7662974.1 cyclic nucleotide-binding domain-containing protein [Pseudomonas lalucatii]MBS7724758.1 cyclic nucleotide-binding domain-containing protein [Pseudomonas lalucatii]QVM87263.1 cyclic nucleotide-binding domain-containing protein [Pseudomonas lalucatii]